MSTQYQQNTKYSKPATCAGCPLESIGLGFTVTKSAPVGAPLIIVDAANHHDVRVGQPLVVDSDAGSVLERAFRLAGLSPESFAFGTLVACKPPLPLSNQPYEFTAPDFCAIRHLAPYIEKYRPRVIVALGSLVARALTGFSGEKQTIDMIRGYVLPGIGVATGIPVIPAPSPSYIMSGMHHEMSLLILDLKKASTCEGIPDDPEPEEYALKAFGTMDQARLQGKPAVHSLEFFLQLLHGDPRRILVYDFEFIAADGVNTKKKGRISTNAYITQVNFTIIDVANNNTLMTMVADWNNDTKDMAIRILQTANIKVGYNSFHIDERVALFNGFEILGKEHHDAMWLVHFLYPDLPARRVTDEEEFLTGDDGALMPLQVAASLFSFPAPWKHLTGKAPHFYGARDTHATAVVFLQGIQRLIERASYGAYDFFVRRYREVLKEAEKRGYPMSRAAMGNLQDFVKSEINGANAKVQDLIPPDLKPYTERRPRSEAETEKLRADYGDALFVRQVYSEDKCECGKSTFGEPAAGCGECHGTGNTEGPRTKCKKCAKHSIVQPHGTVERWTCEWCEWIDTVTVEELSEYYRIHNKPRPKNMKSFFKMRHDDDIRSERYKCPACKGEGKTDTAKPCVCTKRFVYDVLCEKCHGKGLTKGMVPRFCIRLPFNANSPDQLKKYAQSRNHAVPKSGMGREGLAQLARQTGDPVYSVVHGMKVLEAIGGVMAPLTALNSLLENPDDTERIHSNFMFVDAAGAISARNPDIITKPPAHKYPGLAELWDKCLVTRPTETTRLIHLDFGPIELECFALEALDEGLLSIVPNAEEWLLEHAKFKKTAQGTGAVASIFKGFIRATPPDSIFRQNRHLFAAADTVAYLLSTLERQFPRAVEYRRMIANQAHRQGNLRSRFGYERQFFGVIRRGRETGNPEPGADYQNAVSFTARNHAACVLAIAAMTFQRPYVATWFQMITPTEGPFGPNGFLAEVSSDFVPTLDPTETHVLTTPNGQPWRPTITIRELAQ